MSKQIFRANGLISSNRSNNVHMPQQQHALCTCHSNNMHCAHAAAPFTVLQHQLLCSIHCAYAAAPFTVLQHQLLCSIHCAYAAAPFTAHTSRESYWGPAPPPWGTITRATWYLHTQPSSAHVSRTLQHMSHAPFSTCLTLQSSHTVRCPTAHTICCTPARTRCLLHHRTHCTYRTDIALPSHKPPH